MPLRSLRRRGAAPGRALGEDPLSPSLAIEALLAAMRARFGLAAAAADRLLRPALADWRDAVGCADPLLLPANKAPQLVPFPLPSWCAWMIDAGLLECREPPRVEGPRVVLHAALAVVREAELEGVERYPLTFAGRFAPGGCEVHLALSPPFLSRAWRGPVCVRAAAHRQGAPVRLRIGAPSSPAAPSQGEEGETVATWVAARSGEEHAGWPRGWPRWIVLRLLEGREPQALWFLPDLWKARMGDAPEATSSGGQGAPAAMRLGVDLGSTSTVVVEEDEAASGTPGARLVAGKRAPSGFRLLAGDPVTAHRFGCGEQLLLRGGTFPTALAAGSASALEKLVASGEGASQLWLPQAGDGDPPVLADRFKSPELLLLSEWMAALPQLEDPARVSRALLDAYGRLLGLSLAAAHAAPLVVTEGGRWAARWPRLQRAEAVLTVPECSWSGAERFREVFDGTGRALCEGLSAAWDSAAHTLVADPQAASAARLRGSQPVEAFVDFGGLTLQISVRVPHSPGRRAPFITGSSMTYLLGGERLLDAAAFAAAQGLRTEFRAVAHKWRALIARGEQAKTEDAAIASAVRGAIAKVVLPLVTRQLEATLRRAAVPRGAGIRLFLLGEGWKLAALDVPDAQREAEAVRRIARELAGLEVARIDKHRLCQAALRASGEAAADGAPVELQGVDVGSAAGLSQRWFGIAHDGAAQRLGPLSSDPWWRQFAGEAPSLLRMEQWFASPGAFEAGLAAGQLGFDSSRSVLKQWLDVSGASLFALRIHQACARISHPPHDRATSPAR